jgi:hypothetical protein
MLRLVLGIALAALCGVTFCAHADAIDITVIAQPGPVIDINPALARSLPSDVNFSRASLATDGQAPNTGALTTYGTNVPVIVSGLGLLPQEQRTNILPTSNSFNTAGSSATAASTPGPDGTLSGWLLTEDTSSPTSGDAHEAYAPGTGATLSANTTYAVSIYLKAGTRTKARVLFTAGTVGSGVYVDADLQAGTIGTATAFGGGTATAASIQTAAGGWYRVSVVGRLASGVATGYAVAMIENAAGTPYYAGNGTSGLYVYGFQLEQASFASSYIPTTATAVTRSADVASIPLAVGGALSAIINATTAPGASGTQVLAQWDDGTASNRITLQRNASRQIQLVVVAGAVTQATVTAAGTVADTTTFKVGIRVRANDYALTVNGGAVATGSGAVPAGLVTHRIGRDASGNQWDGWISRDRIWLVPLPSARLQISANDNQEIRHVA